MKEVMKMENEQKNYQRNIASSEEMKSLWCSGERWQT